ncbi:phosphopantetheine-binding protein, partial [Roseibium sp. RKSG952]|uniref:phosphopantetheine-binding protein n=1 Tax=Roseibium sp. RKSG952 TaxID=2529384 RepID=UPI0012BC7024
DMDLEAELGIDSIKQVEILSALREEIPEMPELDPAHLSELRTLSQIAGAIGADSQNQTHPVAFAAPGDPDPTEAPANGASLQPAAGVSRGNRQMQDMVLAIVADKTGYPVDMLDLDMELEAELGIDSIKQVEILSALREAMPDMPEMDPSRLSELRTLAQITDALGPEQSEAGADRHIELDSVPKNPVEQVEAHPANVVSIARTSDHDRPGKDARKVRECVLGIVAEKTGYPA